jgi:hypothetical protein
MAKDMIEAARSVARHLGRPFIRVDLYTDDERIWLGEATPAPGEAYYGNYFCFSPEFDLALGEHWSRGHERVGWEVLVLRTEPPRRGRSKSVAAS